MTAVDLGEVAVDKDMAKVSPPPPPLPRSLGSINRLWYCDRDMNTTYDNLITILQIQQLWALLRNIYRMSLDLSYNL